MAVDVLAEFIRITLFAFEPVRVIPVILNDAGFCVTSTSNAVFAVTTVLPAPAPTTAMFLLVQDTDPDQLQEPAGIDTVSPFVAAFMAVCTLT